MVSLSVVIALLIRTLSDDATFLNATNIIVAVLMKLSRRQLYLRIVLSRDMLIGYVCRWNVAFIAYGINKMFTVCSKYCTRIVVGVI